MNREKDGRMDRQTLFYRTLLATARGSNNNNINNDNNINNNNSNNNDSNSKIDKNTISNNINKIIDLNLLL